MADLRKQKDAVMCLSGVYDEDDMIYYAALFKRTMESEISVIVNEQERKRPGKHGLRANTTASMSS